MKKTIITVVGKDTVGIIAKVCTYLADNQVNILDISQTIIDGLFNMMMITDTSASKKSTAELGADLTVLGEEIGVIIRCQREERQVKKRRLRVLPDNGLDNGLTTSPATGSAFSEWKLHLTEFFFGQFTKTIQRNRAGCR